MNTIQLAFHLMARVGRYAYMARRLFYQVVLSDYRRPSCQGSLEMIKEIGATVFKMSPVFIDLFSESIPVGGKLVQKPRQIDAAVRHE